MRNGWKVKLNELYHRTAEESKILSGIISAN